MSEYLREKLEAAAQALSAVVGEDNAAWVTLWMPPEVLAELEGVTLRSTCYVRDDGTPPHSIDIARLTIGRVEFQAQSKSRTSTPEELANVERECDVHEESPFRTNVRQPNE